MRYLETIGKKARKAFENLKSVKHSKIKKVLEIGSFTGFSALSMAISLPDDGSLTSLDKNIEFSKKAKTF